MKDKLLEKEGIYLRVFADVCLWMQHFDTVVKRYGESVDTHGEATMYGEESVLGTFGVVVGSIVLFVGGTIVGAAFGSEGIIPTWLTPIFILPAAAFFDYCTRDQISSWSINKVSTSLGVLSFIPILYYENISEATLMLFAGLCIFALAILREVLIIDLLTDVLNWIVRKAPRK